MHSFPNILPKFANTILNRVPKAMIQAALQTPRVFAGSHPGTNQAITAMRNGVSCASEKNNAFSVVNILFCMPVSLLRFACALVKFFFQCFLSWSKWLHNASMPRILLPIFSVVSFLIRMPGSKTVSIQVLILWSWMSFIFWSTLVWYRASV